MARAGAGPAPAQSRAAAATASGSTASTTSTASSSAAADIATMPTRVAVADGAAHSHPTVSCAHIAMPNARNAASEQTAVARPALTCSDGSSSWPVRPAPVSRASRPPRATFPARRHDLGRSANSASSSSVNSSP